jgi:hypothetical protein
LRATVRPVDADELIAFTDRLSGARGVDALDCRVATGSIVVEHPEIDGEVLVDEIVRLGGILEPDEGDPATRGDGLTPIRSTLGSVDGLLGQLTAGGIDLRTISFVLMLGLAMRQISRGNIMVPAMSLLWWAFEILMKPASAEGGPPEGGGHE